MKCKPWHRKSEPGAFKLSFYNSQLDQTAAATDGHATDWALTTYLDDHKEPTALRLRFSLDDNAGDIDCAFFMSFEVKPPGATAFEVLGSAEIVPFSFTREYREPGLGYVDRCFCNFPAKYRNEFFHMVAQLGELRCLAHFG